MTMKINIKDQYINQFENLLNQLPDDAVIVKKSLDEEIDKRVDEYRRGKMNTVPFGNDLDKIRERLVSQL